MKNYRTIVNKAGDSAEIFMYGPIGSSWFEEGVTAAQFQKDLRAIGDVQTINLRINSEGGVVTDATAIYSLLNEHKATKNVVIDGLAASAASFLAMVGDTITIAEGGFVMIHNARTIEYGDANAMEKTAALLRSFSDTIKEKYVARTGNDAATVQSWMDSETWFTGKEAVQNKFADAYTPNKAAVACVGNERWRECLGFKQLPRALRPNRAEALKLLRA